MPSSSRNGARQTANAGNVKSRDHICRSREKNTRSLISTVKRFKSLYGGQFTLSTHLSTPTVSLETTRLWKNHSCGLFPKFRFTRKINLFHFSWKKGHSVAHHENNPALPPWHARTNYDVFGDFTVASVLRQYSDCVCELLCVRLYRPYCMESIAN